MRGRLVLQASKTCGRHVLIYQSAVTVFRSTSGIVATWPDFAKKTAIICLLVLRARLNLEGGGPVLGIAKLTTVALFLGHIDKRMSHHQ